MLCLHIPGFRLAVHRRRELALAGERLVLVDREENGRVLEASSEAMAAGVEPGMTWVQARGVAADARMLVADEALVAAAGAALLTRLLELGPRVEAGPPGLAYLDTRGLGRLHGTLEELGRRVFATATALGLEGRVGMGRSKLIARLAALVGGAGGPLVIGATRERDFLARLPIEVLEPGNLMRERFFLLGLHTAGQLAALPAEEVASRYGHEGIRMHRLARGEDDEPFRPWQPVPEWVESFDCEGPVDVAERLSFLLCQPLERLLERLSAEGLACQELAAELWVEGSVPTVETRRLALAIASGAAPAALARTFLELLRLELSREPLAGPVTRVRLRVAAASTPHAEQGRLFGRKTGVIASLAQTVARLVARLGRGAVFRPELVDTWRPEATYRASDVGTGPLLGKIDTGCEDSTSNEVDRSQRHRDTEAQRGSCRKADQTLLCASVPPCLCATCPGMQLFAEPQPATVEARDGPPASLLWRHHRHRIAASTGPWPLSGEWWAAAGYARDYHDVETEAGLRLRLFHDRTTGRWFVHGILG